MNCFIHQTSSAVGLCKSCFKALCPECAVDVGNGLACRGECELRVTELNQMWERSAKIYGVGRFKSRIPSTGVLLWGLIATAMWMVSAASYFLAHKTDVGSIVMAVFFSIAFGLAVFSARRTGLKC